MAFKLATTLALTNAMLVILALISGTLLPGSDIIAFGSYTDADIYLLDVTTRLDYNLTHTLDAADFHPVWSPDGSQLAFVSIGGEQGSVRVYVMNDDGGNLRLLADYDGQTTAVTLLWSPDSSQLALSSIAGIHILNVESAFDCVFNIFTSGLCQSAHIGGNVGGTASDWSQNNQLLFISSYNEQQVYVANSDGSHVQRLTDDAAFKLHPRWSPDGEQIAFSSLQSMEHSLYLMDRNGNNLRPIAYNLSDATFEWSPDGRAILYTAWADTNDELYRVEVASGEIQQLTHNALDENFARWSPDGSRIAVLSLGDSDAGLYIMRSDGSQLRVVTDKMSWSFLPSFSWRPQ